MNGMTIKKNTEGELKEKSLLILSPSYPDNAETFFVGNFVKFQIDELKHYFKKIIVISPVLQSFGYLKKDKLCKDYTYENVEVYYPRCIYIPIFWFSKILIDNRLRVVESCISEHDLHFDIIHAHFTWPSGYIAVRLKEKYHKPVVTTIHENGDWFDQEVCMNHPLINRAWTGADALIRVNRKDVPTLQRYNKKVFSIPNGFSRDFHPVDPFLARERLGLPKDAKIIFSLGNLIKRKGYTYLIDAMELICRQQNNVLCFIGGAGPEMKHLQKQIEMTNLKEKVHLLGFLPRDILLLWMSACDVFVLPSLSEGNPTVMFEALGCGKPFIGTKVGGVPEIITSDKYGQMVEPANPDDLAEKIIRALDKEWNRDALLEYSEQYTWEIITKELMEKYDQVLG